MTSCVVCSTIGARHQVAGSSRLLNRDHAFISCRVKKYLCVQHTPGNRGAHGAHTVYPESVFGTPPFCKRRGGLCATNRCCRMARSGVNTNYTLSLRQRWQSARITVLERCRFAEEEKNVFGRAEGDMIQWRGQQLALESLDHLTN